MPLPVKFCPAPTSPERLEELLVVLEPGRERAVLDHGLAARQHDLRLAAVEQVEHGQQLDLAVDELGEVVDRRLEVVHQPLELIRREQRAGLAHPREARLRGWRASRGRPGSSRAPRRAWGGRRRSGCRARAAPPRAPSAARAPSRAGCPPLGQRGRRDVEVRDQVLEAALAAREGGGDLLLSRDQLGEVVQLGAERGVVDDRRLAQGVGRVVERVVQRLAAGLALDVRVLVVVLAGLRLAVERRRRSRPAGPGGPCGYWSSATRAPDRAGPAPRSG